MPESCKTGQTDSAGTVTETTAERRELAAIATAIYPLTTIGRQRQDDIKAQLGKMFGRRKVGTVSIMRVIYERSFEPADAESPRGWTLDTLEDLASEASLEPESAGRLVRMLEKEGWITVRTSDDPNWPARFDRRKCLRSLCWPNLEQRFNESGLQWSLPGIDKYPASGRVSRPEYPASSRVFPSEEEERINLSSSKNASTRLQAGYSAAAADQPRTVQLDLFAVHEKLDRSAARDARADAKRDQDSAKIDAILRAVTTPRGSARGESVTSNEGLPIRAGAEWEKARKALELAGDDDAGFSIRKTRETAERIAALVSYRALLSIDGEHPWPIGLFRYHVRNKPPGAKLGASNKNDAYRLRVETLRQDEARSLAFVKKFHEALSESQRMEFWKVAPKNRLSAKSTYAPLGPATEPKPCAVDLITGFRAQPGEPGKLAAAPWWPWPETASEAPQ